ncbi:MAG: ABC transporter substrate-binding protein [Caldithrix sp.]|nr:ABC transporter substrate-binding protein [Caldithrix sp.]
MYKRSLLIAGLILLFTFGLNAKPTTIKFATLAPDGSTWMDVMNAFKQAVEDSTDGQIVFKIYSGGVQGDEVDVLRKMRFRQLHSAGFTGVGLGEILPEVRILDAPFLFRSYDEIDFISDKFFDRFAAAFEEKGFVLLGWAEVGFVYIYTNTPVRQPSDFKGVKMWMWEGDPLAQATFEAFNVHPIPLSITDVLTSLQTGLIDGVYTSPMGCVTLQWFTKLKYVLDLPLANSNGAVLVSKQVFNRLSKEHQNILRRLGRKYFDELTRRSRIDNNKSQQEMLKSDIKKITIDDPAEIKKFESIGAEARRELVGRLYDQQLLDKVEKAVRQYRHQQKTGGE